ncbi:uncharacterized protein K02A2.6-like [Dendrobium catenatum]|uniref:uncharacterized protein K02A2.6-like n=1 Tax=Dendrobium catenatum TaxID=906689 RepID=UPI0010A08CFC|nr:uncharacterized protein K02A2.6-like [Dendrobium catenatum]
MANTNEEKPIFIGVYNHRILEPALLQLPMAEKISNPSKQDIITVEPQPLHQIVMENYPEEYHRDTISLAVTYYFSKWAEAAPFKEVTSEHVINFFTHNIVYRFGVPRHVILDNGAAFKSTKIYKFVERHKIDWRYSSIYNPRANGLAEAFNKTLVKLLKKILANNKREWHTKMVEALWAYHTTYKTLTKATPYSLVFGIEAVLPLEIVLLSLRVAIQYDLT